MSFIVHRVTKSAARYTDAGGREKCGYCRFFVPPRSCGKVIGPVSPMGWCKHFSRQMVSQFGGSTVTSGIPAGATLALDFMSSGNMPAGITFTRASTATYTDASGVVQTAAVNAPRWDYAGGVLRGLLIEEARTNIALQSGDLANAAWVKVGGPVAAPVVTGNQTTAPDGTLTAARIVYPAVSAATNYSVVYQNFASGSYTASIYLKGSVGGEQLYLGLTDNGANKARVRVTLTTSWQRFTLTASVAAAYGMTLGTDLNDVGQSATTGGTIFAWGAQTEAGLFATSYIPTTSVAVTRAQDQCGILSASMSPWFTTTGTWMAEWIFIDPAPTGRRVVGAATASGTGSIVPLAAGNSPFPLGSWDGSSYFETTNNITSNAVQKGANASAGAAALARLCLNGGTIASVVTTIGFASLATSGVRFLQNVAGVSTDNGNGYIRRVQFWPRVLTDAEMRAVTT